MIDKNKQYRTRSGLQVRIYATDCGGEYPVHGAMFIDGRWGLSCWTDEGKNVSHTQLNLIEVKPRIKGTAWLNVYDSGEVAIHSSREDADEYAGPHRKACIRIPIDCEEGEGL